MSRGVCVIAAGQSLKELILFARIAYDGYLGRSKLIPIGSVLRNALHRASLLWDEEASSVEVEVRSFDCTGEDESLRLGQSLCCKVSVDKGVSV